MYCLCTGELDSRGWKLQDIILVHLYVKSMADFVPINTIYKKHFGVNPPARYVQNSIWIHFILDVVMVASVMLRLHRVCVQAPLAAGRLLQMDCLLHAWTKPLEEGCFHERGALHVQSMSHWAPANIGPYSQAVRVRLKTKWRKPRQVCALKGCDTEQPGKTLRV